MKRQWSRPTIVGGLNIVRKFKRQAMDRMMAGENISALAKELGIARKFSTLGGKPVRARPARRHRFF